jgi:flagellar hook assembly protein FlgD
MTKIQEAWGMEHGEMSQMSKMSQVSQKFNINCQIDKLLNC